MMGRFSNNDLGLFGNKFYVLCLVTRSDRKEKFDIVVNDIFQRFEKCTDVQSISVIRPLLRPNRQALTVNPSSMQKKWREHKKKHDPILFLFIFFVIFYLCDERHHSSTVTRPAISKRKFEV